MLVVHLNQSKRKWAIAIVERAFEDIKEFHKDCQVVISMKDDEILSYFAVE